jgi:hypothetical protein
MVLQYQAFIDESDKNEEFVLGGYIQTAEVWANFVRDWKPLLALGVKDKYGNLQFHMTQMKERMNDVKLFSDVIDKHNLFPVSFRMNLPCFRRAISVVEERFAQYRVEIDWERWSDPYYFSFRHFLHGFHQKRHAIEPEIPLSDKIDFYFDRRGEGAVISQAWEDVRARMTEEEEELYGENPRFENKQDFLGLQAADFWAWWVREWYEEDDSEVPTRLRLQDFRGWRGKRRLNITSSASEEYIIEALTNMTLETLSKRGLIRATF